LACGYEEKALLSLPNINRSYDHHRFYSFLTHVVMLDPFVVRFITPVMLSLFITFLYSTLS